MNDTQKEIVTAINGINYKNGVPKPTFAFEDDGGIVAVTTFNMIVHISKADVDKYNTTAKRFSEVIRVKALDALWTVHDQIHQVGDPPFLPEEPE